LFRALRVGVDKPVDRSAQSGERFLSFLEDYRKCLERRRPTRTNSFLRYAQRPAERLDLVADLNAESDSFISAALSVGILHAILLFKSSPLLVAILASI
jgi:hypothetical protein